MSDEYTKSVLKQAVTKAYNEGYKQRKDDAKIMLLDAFEVWDNVLIKIGKEQRR